MEITTSLQHKLLKIKGQKKSRKMAGIKQVAPVSLFFAFLPFYLFFYSFRHGSLSPHGSCCPWNGRWTRLHATWKRGP
ncbi:hypothetical protein DM01DRAFT_154683 [Hesseltinella vesiculosa]|uniref:Uncharacterized protein n=1 Tax=Hesseltinella vesiculosa TaxID=101127 RepID=A0A1X2GL19_9FUNG|nr:hypothetical protein DM01DRAFT_154683 [Hesseltinella vesiculosa]